MSPMSGPGTEASHAEFQGRACISTGYPGFLLPGGRKTRGSTPEERSRAAYHAPVPSARSIYDPTMLLGASDRGSAAIVRQVPSVAGAA